MAKINHNNLLETINESIESAKAHQVLHQYAEGNFLKGDSLRINGHQLTHFGTTGYLGLEQDPRLKHAAAEAVLNFGTQFPLSKTYISHPLYGELEKLLSQMYGWQSMAVAKNSTLAHIGAIPHAVGYDDVVILDHQVHWSVQNACQHLKLRGIPVFMIRHNDMEQLEELLIGFKSRYQKVWYMADGVYSMYGDCVPVERIKGFMKRYKSLHLYFDDVHGMSWTGINGSGFIRSHWGFIPERMILVSTLSKTFGASGSFILSGDALLIQRIRNFGGPLTFSAQLEPSAVAAAIASAKIHLSPEITLMQEKLRNRIKAFASSLAESEIPVMSEGTTPVFYIPTGMPDTAYALVRRLVREGFYINPALFPAVPVNKAGLRITISNHISYQEIYRLAKALSIHYPKALVESGNTYEKVNRVFKKNFQVKDLPLLVKKELFRATVYGSVSELDEPMWNELLGDHAFDYKGIQFLEGYFSGLEKEDPNLMEFKYHVVTNSEDKIVALTHTSTSLWKEDMLSHASVSRKIEAIRKEDPYFLTDKVLSTGSVFTEGVHVYLDRNSKDLRFLQRTFFDSLEDGFEKDSTGKLVLRDFKRRGFLSSIAHSRGYVIVDMPESAVFSDFNWDDLEGFEQMLSKRSRRHFREEVLPFVNTYEVSVCTELNKQDLQTAFELYLEVKANNLAINNFSYGYGLFEAMNDSPLWQFMILKKKGSDVMEGIMFCYVNEANNSFNPVLIGFRQQDEERLVLYRQLLFQTILYAKSKSFSKVYLGVSAIFEKRKLGAQVFYKVAYVRMKDNYNTDLLQTFE